MSDLMLIAVPQGRVDGKAVLSVVVTPRLTEGNLASAGMADWPAVVGAAQVRVLTRPAGGATSDATELRATVRSTARSDVWQHFTSNLTVAPYSRPRGYHAPAVATTSDDADRVKATYTRVVSAVGAPHVQLTAGRISSAYGRTVEEELQGWQEVSPRPQQVVRDEAERRDGPPDFHLAVARLREHPEMLRLLGLVFDVVLEELPESAADREISIAWDAAPVPVASRWTRYEFNGELFLPASQGDVSEGMVDLTVPGRWRIVTFDVDGGVAKLQQAARSASEDRSRQDEGAPSAGSRPSLPPLRSAGMMLTRVGREARLAQRAADGLAAATDGQDDKVLMAEDLVLGYRIDVRLEAGNTWFSLHRRKATYAMGAVTGIVVEDEEGHVKPHAAVIDGAGLRTDEVVARWDGWSLSVPRPRLDGSPSAARRSPSAQMPYEFKVSYDPVPASLLEQEFGEAYQMRARVADIAGGGLQRTDPAAEGFAAHKETYARYEPVPPPRLVVPDCLLVFDETQPGGFRIDPSVVGPGGSLERLVIRSAATPHGFSSAPFDGDPAYPDNHTRRVEAPATTFTIAEHHGLLRLADETGVATASRAFLGGRVGEPSVDIVATPELPDPASFGMAVAVLEQRGLLEEEKFDDRPWEGDWPEIVGKTLELVPGDGGSPRVQWVTEDDQSSPDGAASPRVQVILPPGCQVDVELSSPVLQNWIGKFALNLFLSDGSPEGTATAAQNAMVSGRHPLLNSPRTLMLTHAVRQPLAKPHGKPEVQRFAGETVALVTPADNPTWGLHVPSTGAVDVVVRWDEWNDGSTPTASSAVVTQLNLLRGSTSLPDVRHDFGDTKHRTVTFGLTAISRFRDCFTKSDDPSLFRLDGDLEPVSVQSTARPGPPAVVSVVPAFSWQEERGQGTITRTRLGGRLRVELARPWYITGEGESLAVVVAPSEEASLLSDPSFQGGNLERVTWTNRDPIHATKAPTAIPAEAAFAGFESAHNLPLSEGGPMVRALSYPVFFHEGGWFSDVSLPGVAASSYSPFVRLAVARFQAESLVGPGLDLRMSTVVTSDIAPVLPDRTLVVRRGAAGLEVSLSGLTRLSDKQPTNRVFASIEQLDADIAHESVELASTGLGDPGFPSWRRVADGTVSGTVNVALPPLVLPSGPGRFRVVVREVEELGANLAVVGVDGPSELDHRTVFVDVVDLTDL